MPDIRIEQALYGNPGPGGFRFLGRSPGFADDWLPLAERLCTGFGERPAGVACPDCVFAQPFVPQRVVVVQVADLGSDDAQRPGAIGFRLLVLARGDYEALTGDPFLLAERFPPSWQERGDLPALSWPNEAPPRRTVAHVQAVLQNGDSATLLGGAQALIDAGHLVFERPAPATDLLRRLWLLLPNSTRSTVWPASFAFGNALHFDVLVVPRADPEAYVDYLREEQAGDYPEGRYELGLQIAAEAGDQRSLDALFHRRSSAQTVKLGILVLIGTALAAVVMNFLTVPAPRPATKPRTAKSSVAATPSSAGAARLALADHYPPLAPDVRKRLGEALHSLAEKIGLALPEEATVEEMLADVVKHLQQPPAAPQLVERLRQVEALREAEPQLRGLLRAYGIESYNDPRLNPVELVELLQKTLAKDPS